MGTPETIAALQVQGIIFNKGATAEQVAATEMVLDIKFPFEFTQFYLLANGFDSNSCMTNGLFNIWPLEQIQEEWLADDSKNFIPFGDYLIHSHWIGFLKTKPGVFKYYNIGNEVATCETFTEALILATQQESDLQ